MCEKKPGPRCASHLTSEVTTLAKTAQKQKATLEALQEQKRQLDVERNGAPFGSDERKALVAKGDKLFYDKILPAQKALHITEVKKRDAEKRLLGTKTGQKLAAERIAELEASGEYGFNIENYKRQAEIAREAHEKNLRYAKWAEKVRSGEVPGRWVDSEGTQQSPHLEYSDDPLYDATREEIASLSAEDLQMTLSSRYGGNAMTPATKEKVLDEIRRRSNEPNAEYVAQHEERLAASNPAAYQAVLKSDFNGNYLHLDPMNIHYSSKVKMVASGLKTTVRNSKDERISYPDALGRAVSKVYVPGGGSGDTLVLDDGSTVKVSRDVYAMLRLDGGRTGLVKQ